MTNLGHVYKKKQIEELNNLEKQRKMNSTLLVNIFSIYFIIDRSNCYIQQYEFL
jgi:hypothetical protein